MSDERYTLIAYQPNTPAGNDSHFHTYPSVPKEELLDIIVGYTTLNVKYSSDPLISVWDLTILEGSSHIIDFKKRQRLYAEAHDLALFRKM